MAASTALRYHYLMPISCHFQDCKALLIASLTHVRSAIPSRLYPLYLRASSADRPETFKHDWKCVNLVSVATKLGASPPFFVGGQPFSLHLSPIHTTRSNGRFRSAKRVLFLTARTDGPYRRPSKIFFRRPSVRAVRTSRSQNSTQCFL